MKTGLIFAVLLVSVSNGAKLPSDIRRCDIKDPNESTCMVEALQAIVEKFTQPIPEIGLPTIDPLYVPALTIGAATGSVSVQQYYKDIKVVGFSKMQIKNVKFDFAKKKFTLEALLPELKQVSDYEVSGKILLLPVQGTGPSVLTLENCNMLITADFEEVERRGKRFLNFTNSKLKMTPQHVVYRLENLFNGDKVLGDQINNLLNDNWKEIFEEVEEGFEGAYIVVFQELYKSVFSRVPLSEFYHNKP